jgi:hypothetical protein
VRLAGLALALASRKVIERLLFGVASNDSVLMGLSILAMSAAALSAGYLPAH